MYATLQSCKPTDGTPSHNPYFLTPQAARQHVLRLDPELTFKYKPTGTRRLPQVRFLRLRRWERRRLQAPNVRSKDYRVAAQDAQETRFTRQKNYSWDSSFKIRQSECLQSHRKVSEHHHRTCPKCEEGEVFLFFLLESALIYVKYQCDSYQRFIKFCSSSLNV